MIGISVGSRAGGWPSTQELAHAHSGICRAVALGWQVAQLFHSPVHRGRACDPERGDHLPGRSEFPGASQSTWLGEQIQSQMSPLLTELPPVLAEAMSDVLALLTDPGRSRDATLDAIFTLHCRLLEALTVADFLLGKAYGLGRAMAETTMLPANAITSAQRLEQFQNMFEAGRLITIKDWLADLKTLLPDHTAYAVSRGLHDWQHWVEQNPPAGDWDGARSAIRVQGRIWRELLTGEKAARDVLSLSDYLATAKRGTGQVIRRSARGSPGLRAGCGGQNWMARLPRPRPTSPLAPRSPQWVARQWANWFPTRIVRPNSGTATSSGTALKEALSLQPELGNVVRRRASTPRSRRASTRRPPGGSRR